MGMGAVAATKRKPIGRYLLIASNIQWSLVGYERLEFDGLLVSLFFLVFFGHQILPAFLLKARESEPREKTGPDKK